jgi:hypothetical protein
VRQHEELLLLSLLFAMAYLVGQALVWRNITGDLLATLPLWQSLRVWSLSNMGRYLPGSVWHLLGRIYLGQKAGMTRRDGALSLMVEQGLQFLAALIITTLSLPFWPEGSVVYRWAWLALLVPLGVAVSHPRIYFPVMNRLLTLMGREPVQATIPFGAMLRTLSFYIVVHLMNGLALVCVALALGVSASLAPAVVGAALFAWTVGFLTVVAPGGLGVREWLVTLVLSPLTGRDAAFASALLWRAANVLTEALAALVFDLLWRMENGE